MPSISGSLGSESPPEPVITTSAVTSPWSVLTSQTCSSSSQARSRTVTPNRNRSSTPASSAVRSR